MLIIFALTLPQKARPSSLSMTPSIEGFVCGQKRWYRDQGAENRCGWALSRRELCNSLEQRGTGNLRVQCLLPLAQAAWHLGGVKLWSEGA